jgi:hypothetical protein
MTVVDRLKQKFAGDHARRRNTQDDLPLGVPECLTLAPVPPNLCAEIAKHNEQCVRFSAATQQAETDTVELAAAMTADVPAKEMADRAASLRLLRYDLARSRVALLAAKGRLCQRLADAWQAKSKADADAVASVTSATEKALTAAGLSPAGQLLAVAVAQSDKVRAAQKTLENTMTAIGRLRDDAVLAASQSEGGAWRFVTEAWDKLVAGIL